MSSPSRRTRPWWTPLAGAGVASALLLAAAAFVAGGAHDALELVVRTMGEVFEAAGRQTLGTDEFPISPEGLERFLHAYSADGLRYVAVLSDDGAVAVSAGEAIGSGARPEPSMVGPRTRVVFRMGPRHPRPLGRQDASIRVVYEFEAEAGRELKRRADGVLFVAGLCCLGMLGLGLGLSRSLSQGEKLREELERGRRLAAMGTMSAVLAHELRNPLASLKGHAQLLAEAVEKDGRLSPKADRVVSETVRLERLTNDLLDFARSGELRCALVDPNVVLRSAADAAGGAIEVSYSPGPLRASLDAGRLQQALENLLRNAAQASPPDAKVRAGVSQVGASVVFTVRDSGPGIAPGEEERIFEPFVTGRVRGVGLGLAIARRIVELHGGAVSARNHPQGGAEFEVRIPGGHG